MRVLGHALFIGLLALSATSCGTASSARQPDEYLGCSTDENWRTFDDRELTGFVKLDDETAPVLTNLTEGMALPASPAYTLSWKLSPTVDGKPTGSASCEACPSCGVLQAQHEPPVSGDVFDLQFSSDGVLRWRVLTTLQSYQFSEAAWGVLKGKKVALRITRMQVKENDIVDGPIQPKQPLSFTIAN